MSRYVLSADFRPNTTVLEWSIIDTSTGTEVSTVYVFDGTAQFICECLNENENKD